MGAMTTSTPSTGSDTADLTCDKVRDLWPAEPGKLMLTCDKPLNHDKRGPHRMRNEHGKVTCTWRGADND